jgi:hypothetical protein
MWQQLRHTIDDFIPQAEEPYAHKAEASATHWEHFDQLWRAWYPHAQAGLSRNYGATHDIGAAKLHLASPAEQARTYQRGQRKANHWRWLTHRLSEAIAAHRQHHPPWTTGWSGWVTGVLARLDLMHKQQVLPPEDYWYWLAAAHRVPDPDFDTGAWRDIASAQATHLGNTELKAHTQAWKEKVRHALAHGTGWAHRITKPDEAPALPRIGTEGNTSLAAQL